MKSRLVQKVRLRRNGQLLGELPTRALIQGIKKGSLKPSDEFSGDGVHWSTLAGHHQLARYFEASEDNSPLNRQLGELAQMLDEINHG